MPTVIALGARLFVRQLMLGGAQGRVAEKADVAEKLLAALEEPGAGLILLDAALAEGLPRDLAARAFANREPQVVALGAAWDDSLRRRIRQVLGADLLGDTGLIQVQESIGDERIE